MMTDLVIEMEGRSVALRCKVDGCTWRQAIPLGGRNGDEYSWDPAVARKLWLNHFRIAHPQRIDSAD
jgi:hypothetical protein